MTVIREGIVKECKNGILSVCFERPEACEKCGACAGNAHTHLAQVAGEALPGDRVAVEMPEAKVFRISLLVYAVPLAAFIAGLLIGCLLLGSDPAGAALALLLMAASYILLRRVDKRIKNRPEYSLRLIAVVHAGEDKKPGKENEKEYSEKNRESEESINGTGIE